MTVRIVIHEAVRAAITDGVWECADPTMLASLRSIQTDYHHRGDYAPDRDWGEAEYVALTLPEVRITSTPPRPQPGEHRVY